MTCHFPDCLADPTGCTCYPPAMSPDVRAIVRDVVPRDVDERCTTQCLRGNVAECVCHPPIDGHYRKDVVPVTSEARKRLAEELFQEAMDTARRVKHAD